MPKQCKTPGCQRAIPDTNNREFCKFCAEDRIREKAKGRPRKTRSIGKLLELKMEKRDHDHCQICGHKLAESNCTGECYHHETGFYAKEAYNPYTNHQVHTQQRRGMAG